MSKQIPSKLMLKLVLDALPVRIFWKDTDLTYLGCNQHFADDAGVKSPADLEGYCDFDFFEKDIADLFREDDRIVMDTGIPKVGYEEPQANPGGETRWLRTNKVPLKDLSGEIVGVLGTYEDITEQKLLRQKIERMAHEDELTGLPNRNQFKKSLDAAIERLKEPDHLIGLLLLDLDNFKNVNDTLGHLVGDKLLQVIADRIRENLPENSIAARLGGDEFAFIFSDLQSPEMIIKFANDISSAIEEPINIDDHLLNVGASMGLITHSDSECSPHELFKNADIALYEAKREGKSDYCIYDSSMNIKVQLNQKIENDLCSAIRNGELYTLYQPQVCLQTGNVVGAETLLRWKHPELGMISPDTFITVAESKNIIIDIGYYVLEQACTFCSELNNKSDSPITVSVNLSLSQFKDRGLQENILDEVLKSNIKPHMLELEITESIAMLSGDLAVKILNELKSTGIKLAIDDFGTGYSSLQRLTEFPVDCLKIDKSFISAIEGSPRDLSIADTIIKLGNNFNLKIVAEGVETIEQLKAVNGLGCHIVQGYYFSEPLSASEFKLFLQNFTPDKVMARLTA